MMRFHSWPFRRTPAGAAHAPAATGAPLRQRVPLVPLVAFLLMLAIAAAAPATWATPSQSALNQTIPAPTLTPTPTK